MRSLSRTAAAVLAAFLIAMAGISAAFATPPPDDLLGVMDLFELESAHDPQLSPDGKTIVYVRRFADVMTDRRYANIWAVGFDGTNHRPLTTGNCNDGSPRWSPDGSRLIFISDRDGSAQIYLLRLDGGETAKLTRLTDAPRGIRWSPDGRWIAFTSRVPAEPRAVAAAPAPPEGAEWADPVVIIDRLIYRADHFGYLKAGYTHLFVIPADGGTPRRLSSGPYDHDKRFDDDPPVWTPDGKHILLSAIRKEDADYQPLDTEIYQFAVEDGAVKALTDRRGPDDYPAVSPDGRQIAFLGFDDAFQGYQVTRLYVMNRDGSGARALTGDLDRSVAAPAWSPDGRGIYVKFPDQGNTRLAFVSLDGEVTRLQDNLGSGGSAYDFASAFTVGPGGRYAFTYTTPYVPGDIATGRLEDPGQARPVTHVNKDLLDNRKLGVVAEIRYRSSHDDREIHGWIIKPPRFDAAKKYPLLLEIHGGPFADYGDRFDAEKQIQAASGYVVLYTNPRGSTSYGEEFGNLIHHAYPGDDFYDLNSGVDAVIARGYVDPDQLYVTGGSGGGVLTCWMIGRTERFRAAASAYPVINWYSFVLTADLPSFFTRYWFPGMPWDHTEHYMKRSLLSVVGKVKTPTLVITGEDDFRTPMSESEQYYTALKLQKVDTVLVRVPDEPHGVRVRPSHHAAKILNVLGWFEEHSGK
jgi:acylaminoacyl-peptidase